ncbi:MAG: hypothetical protein AB1742_07415 [bacterium]
MIFLFGKVAKDLNMYIEEIKPGFPDCIGRRFSGKGWEKVTIEFEYKSSHFQQHNHDPEECDIIVCWEHDWPECPVEVVELKQLLPSFENEPVERPGESPQGSKDDLERTVKNHSEAVKKLIFALEKKTRSISDDVWYKISPKKVITFYSPERVFMYCRLRKQRIRLTLFTGGEQLRGIKNCEAKSGGFKWGLVSVKNEKELEKVFPSIKKSFLLIKKAIKNNEPTGWHAEIEDEE